MNCTFVGNRTWQADAAVRCLTRGNATLTDCALWCNSAPHGPEIAPIGPATLTISYSDVEGGEAAVYIEGDRTPIWGDDDNDIDLSHLPLSMRQSGIPPANAAKYGLSFARAPLTSGPLPVAAVEFQGPPRVDVGCRGPMLWRVAHDLFQTHKRGGFRSRHWEPAWTSPAGDHILSR